MRVPKTTAPLLAVALLACERATPRAQQSLTFIETGVAAAMDSTAEAISRRDPQGALGGASTDNTVVYVSDGYVMRGTDAAGALARFYSGLTKLEFRWMRREIMPLAADAAVATAWAAIAWEDTAGVSGRDSAVFTLVYARGANGWHMVTAQKTTLPK